MPQKKHFSSSLENRLYTAEFDDALVDAAHWKNPRYAGCKLTGLKINEYHGTDPFIDQPNTSSAEYLAKQIPSSSDSSVWGGDISYGLNPVINKETTAIYIANTVVGGTENPSYATLEGHSYVGISKILLVNMQDNTVRIIDRETEPYDSFHRFITSDFPTGTKLNIKVLDPAIQSNLEGNYRCRMNKGWLLSSFKYLDYLNDNGMVPPGLTESIDIHNNPLELFDESDLVTAGVYAVAFSQELNRLSFRFGIKEDNAGVFAGGVTNNTFGVGSGGGHIPIVDFSPNYTGATIVPNKFTKQYYSGSLTFPSINTGGDGAFLSASRFILNKTVDFLTKNFETTELHLTINKGTIDFAPKFGDERSMSTFEVDRGYGASGEISHNDENEITSEPLLLPVGSLYGHNTPLHHILQLKGTSPFTPTTTPKFNSDKVCMIREETDDAFVGQFTHNRNTYFIGDEGIADYPQYSGSAAFELSFLDKDHTLILNIDKDEELFDGIGSKGVALISEHIHGTIKSNLEYYLEKAGVIDNATNFQA